MTALRLVLDFILATFAPVHPPTDWRLEQYLTERKAST